MEDDDEFIEEFKEKQEGSYDSDDTYKGIYAWQHTKPSNVELWLREEQTCYEGVDQPRAEELGPEVWEPYGGREAVACDGELSRRWERSEVRVRLLFRLLKLLLTSHRVCGSTQILEESSMQCTCHFRYESGSLPTESSAPRHTRNSGGMTVESSMSMHEWRCRCGL